MVARIRILGNIFNISGQQRDQIAQPKLSRNAKMDTSMKEILKNCSEEGIVKTRKIVEGIDLSIP